MCHIAIRVSLIAVIASNTPFDSPRRNCSLRCRSLSRPFAAPDCSQARSPLPSSHPGAPSPSLSDIRLPALAIGRCLRCSVHASCPCFRFKRIRFPYSFHFAKSVLCEIDFVLRGCTLGEGRRTPITPYSAGDTFSKASSIMERLHSQVSVFNYSVIAMLMIHNLMIYFCF
ncbi:hypothetical protein Taro_045005, partial [Colocasia esculenta]|nr:hypothetical protein [Colocasia esculenta]